MQSGAQANGLVKRVHGRSRGERFARCGPEDFVSACPHPRQASPQAPRSHADGVADIMVPRSTILINYSAIRK